MDLDRAATVLQEAAQVTEAEREARDDMVTSLEEVASRAWPRAAPEMRRRLCELGLQVMSFGGAPLELAGTALRAALLVLGMRGGA